MMNDEVSADPQNHGSRYPKFLGVAFAVVVSGVVGVDFVRCANQVNELVSYPIISQTPFVVEKPAKFTGEPQTFVGVAMDPSGSVTTVSGNMVVLKDQAHYTWGGPSPTTLGWGLNGEKESLTFDANSQQMTRSRSSERLSGAECHKETTFDSSGTSQSVTTYSFWGQKIYTTAPVPADKDEYKYGWAKETISGALSRAMESFNVVYEKNKLSGEDDAFDARMCKIFEAKFTSMQPTDTSSDLHAITPSRDGVQQKDKYIEMTSGAVTVRLYDTGVVENIESYDGGKKQISVVVDPQGTVMAMHQVLNDIGRNFSFIHIMTDKGDVNGWAESSNAQTGGDDRSVKLIIPMQGKEVLENLGIAALANAIAVKQLQMTQANNVMASLRNDEGLKQ